MSSPSFRHMIGVTMACAIVLLGCERAQGGHPRSEDAYTAALAAVNATQVARNVALHDEHPAGSEPAGLVANLSQLIPDLDAYAADLERLAPPTKRHQANQQMVDATRSLISNSAKLRDIASTDDQSAFFDALKRQSELLSTFKQACRALDPSFVCGSLIEAGVPQ